MSLFRVASSFVVVSSSPITLTCLLYKFFVIFPPKVVIDLGLQLFVHRQFG